MERFENAIKYKRTENGYEITYYSFKSKRQLPAFMVIKEYCNTKGEIEHANVLFSID